MKLGCVAYFVVDDVGKFVERGVKEHVAIIVGSRVRVTQTKINVFFIESICGRCVWCYVNSGGARVDGHEVGVNVGEDVGVAGVGCVGFDGGRR